MTTATLPQPQAVAVQAPGRGPGRRRRKRRPELEGHFEETITGRYRTIPAHQLALAWWCLKDGHIRPRQLRVYFAAHEMAERRAYGRTRGGREEAVYDIREVQELVGGRGSARAARELRADVRRLAELGLATITTNSIRFAKSVDGLTVGEGGGEAFADFLEGIPNRSRIVPVPRRMVRALAAGFSRSVTAYIIAALIRSVFWHRDVGRYRVDGRMKLGDVHEPFGLCRRSFTTARAFLIELGWLQPLEVPQWAANRYGVHDIVNVHWSPANDADVCTEAPTELPPVSVDNSASVGEGSDVDSARPSPRSDVGSATPCLNRSLPTETKNTRRPGRAPDPAGVSFKKEKGKPIPPPTIRDVQPHDLDDTDRLLELHRQAIAAGIAHGGGAGQLDFFAMANRARARGHNPGGLLRWLLANKRSDYITIADEEAARRRISEHHNGPFVSSREARPRRTERRLTPDEQIVELCLRLAQQHRIEDPFRVARRHPEAKDWSREQWDRAQASYRTTQARQWYRDDEFELDFASFGRAV